MLGKGGEKEKGRGGEGSTDQANVLQHQSHYQHGVGGRKGEVSGERKGGVTILFPARHSHQDVSRKGKRKGKKGGKANWERK